MKEKEITTVYDERYYALLTIKAKELKQIICRGKEYVGYINTVNRPPGEEPVVVGMFVEKEKYKSKTTVLLNKNDVMLLNALFHLYLNTDGTDVDTDWHSIYHKILGQSVKTNSNNDYSITELSLNKLDSLYVFIGTRSELQHLDKGSFFRKLIGKNVSSSEKKSITFKFGGFGNDIRNRKRYSNLIPIKFLRCKNISKYYISLAICRYIYINAKKKNRLYSFKLVTILKQINYFDRNGNNTGKSYYELLRQDGLSNKTYILKQFIKTVKEVLNTLISENKIKGFSLLGFDDNASVLKYTDYTIELALPPRKYH